MNVETLIYAYLAICTCMIAFNCACVVVFRRQDRALRQRSSRLEEAVAEQIRRVQAGEPVEDNHEELLRKKLPHTRNLMAFDGTMERLVEQSPGDAWAYIQEIRPVFTFLAMENRYHSPMKLAYFAYVLRKYRIVQGTPAPTVMELLLRLLEEPSLYCRENALQAIYSTEDCGYVLRALRAVDESGRFHHAKLLTDGLLAFSGDRQELAGALWADFDSFSVSMRVVILDFIRFGGVERKEELLHLLADSRQDDEIRFSCIRYFGRYPYEPAYPLLISFVERPGDRRWEYAAIAATALGAYPGERTIGVLKKALNSSSWYVRFNAAKSLEGFQLTYLELSDVMESGDRYAREILQYQMDMENAKQAREEVLV